MGLIFNKNHVGSTVLLPSGSQPATFSLIGVKGQDALGGFTGQKSIITGWNYEENVNVQFTHTMGSDIYLNVFGNRMGVFSATGLSFAASATAQAGPCVGDKHGVESIIDWYDKNRVSNKDADKVTIQIGSNVTVSGYVISASYSAQDPETWTVQYTIQVAVIPK